MALDVQTRLRADPAAIQSWLDRLDHDARPPRGLDVRLSPRVAFRAVDLVLELLPGGTGSSRHAAAGRNLSREGIGLLVSRFAYPGTRCRVLLGEPSEAGPRLSGQVRHCRYVVGSGSLYEMGVEFDRPIDVTRLVPNRPADSSA